MNHEKIFFSRSASRGRETDYLQQVLAAQRWGGNGKFSQRCEKFLQQLTGVSALLMPSCTAGLETLCLLAGLQPGDEVIMPSFTFVSTANAVVLRGGIPVFVDIRPETMNIDERLVESAVTERTRAVIAVHYAGIACEMNALLEICNRRGLLLLEDAAQGIMAEYREQPLGSIGDGGAISFHDTKNLGCGEGGALLTRRPDWLERAEILREKGTNRSQFFRGEIDKYTWVDVGGSQLPSEFAAAVLLAQLEVAEEIQNHRIKLWNRYRSGLSRLTQIEQPFISSDRKHNGHIYWMKTDDEPQRAALIRSLAEEGIQATFHYVPLHTSPAGMRFGRFHGEDCFTTRESDRLLRLPLHSGLSLADVDRVCEHVVDFFVRSAQ